MRIRNLVLVAVVFAAMFAAWVIGHQPADGTSRVHAQAHMIRPFGT